MTFLQKFASILRTGLQIATGVALPVAQTYAVNNGVLDRVANSLDQIGSTVVMVEVLGQALDLKGPQKLIAASGPVAQILLQSSVMVGKKIAQPELFQAGATKIASGMADVLNSLHEDGVKAVKA